MHVIRSILLYKNVSLQRQYGIDTLIFRFIFKRTRIAQDTYSDGVQFIIRRRCSKKFVFTIRFDDTFYLFNTIRNLLP